MKTTKEISVVEFLAKRFSDEETAIVFFAEKRWGNKIECPYFDSERVYVGTFNYETPPIMVSCQ